MCSRRGGSQKKITILVSATQRVDNYGSSRVSPTLTLVLLLLQSYVGGAETTASPTV